MISLPIDTCPANSHQEKTDLFKDDKYMKRQTVQIFVQRKYAGFKISGNLRMDDMSLTLE